MRESSVQHTPQAEIQVARLTFVPLLQAVHAIQKSLASIEGTWLDQAASPAARQQ